MRHPADTTSFKAEGISLLSALIQTSFAATAKLAITCQERNKSVLGDPADHTLRHKFKHSDRLRAHVPRVPTSPYT